MARSFLDYFLLCEVVSEILSLHVYTARSYNEGGVNAEQIVQWANDANEQNNAALRRGRLHTRSIDNSHHSPYNASVPAATQAGNILTLRGYQYTCSNEYQSS